MIVERERVEVVQREPSRSEGPRLAAVTIAALLTVWLAAPATQADIAASLESVAAKEFERDRPGGVVVVAQVGRTLLHRAYGLADIEQAVPMRIDHVFKIGSITKPFTAVAMLMLAADGRVALDADVRRYIAEFETHGRRITVEQVLSHTSGLPNLVDLPDFGTVARQDYETKAVLALTRHVPLHFEPGTSYRYSDTGYILLGAIIEDVTGLSYGQFIEQTVGARIGLRDTVYSDDRRIILRRARGYSWKDGLPTNATYISMTVPHAAGALASTAGDLLRWQRALRGANLLPRSLLAEAWRPRILPDGTPTGYGLGFQLCHLAGRRTIEHGGFVNGFGAQALQLPEEDLDVIVLVNNDSDRPDAGALGRRLARVFLTGLEHPRYEKLSSAQRAALAGGYKMESGDLCRIIDVDGALYLESPKLSRTRLEALSPTELTPADSEGGYVLKFAVGADGGATAFRPAMRCEPLGIGRRVE
jgi:CubicO group peptidase (beta-lactamase class C family)